MMNQSLKRVCIGLMLGACASKSMASTMTLEQKYQEVFVSAGYATAMGAAVGAAALAFQEKPSEHLRYIAVGASVGFFAGTLFGGYVAIAPAFASNAVEDQRPESESSLFGGIVKKSSLPTPVSNPSDSKVVLKPVFHTHELGLKNFEATFTLAQF